MNPSKVSWLQIWPNFWNGYPAKVEAILTAFLAGQAISIRKLIQKIPGVQPSEEEIDRRSQWCSMVSWRHHPAEKGHDPSGDTGTQPGIIHNRDHDRIYAETYQVADYRL